MTRSNQALIAAASAGDRSAFAALVARTAPDIATHLPEGSDRHTGLLAVYTAAMRDLSRGATPTDVTAWLRQHAQNNRPSKRRGRSDHPMTFDPDLDQLWRELAPLWPKGQKRFIRLSRPATLTSVAVLLLVGTAFALIQTQAPRLEANTLIATVYQAENSNQPAIDQPPADPNAITVPVIPLPPLDADDPRPTQPDPPPSEPESQPQPDEQDEQDEPDKPDDTADEPTDDPQEPDDPEPDTPTS